MKDARYRAGGHWRTVCKQCMGRRYRANVKSDPSRYARLMAYQGNWAKAHRLESKIKAYRAFDKKRGLSNSISLDAARGLIVGSECFYCGSSDQERLGLDRINNELGHSADNVKVCCEVCNNILTDLLFDVKLLLSAGLREARNRGLLSNYIIKTKRPRKREIA